MTLPPSRARDDLRAYHFRLGCAALLAIPSHVPLLVIAHAFGISSLPMMLMLVLGYYRSAGCCYYRAILPAADRRGIG